MVFFAENTVKLFVKNIKEEPLRNLTECIQNKKNMSQIWFCGFELATNHDCSLASNFSIGKLLRNVQKLCGLQNQ